MVDLNADIDVETLVEQYPQAVGFLAERGIVCIRCGEPYWGTLRELARTKGMDGQIEEIVHELTFYLTHDKQEG